MSQTGCPPEDELVRMVEGALGDMSLAALESHVATCEACAAVIGQLAALGSSSAKPRVVGRYQLDRRIGGGGMGEVWAAWDPQLRRDIAVKLVKPENADDGRERERLKREARALARLGHPNVLAVYDVGETEDEVFIATELVVGDTLASRGGANADWRALVKLYSQAARGLAAAHAAGLVHRDIKPANLLIGMDGRVRVADFGLAVPSATPSPIAPTELAVSKSAHVQVTQTGYIAGTPAYMAPEQRLGEPADARADQYALCIALVEGIAGRRPALDIGHDAMIAFVAERRAREPDLDRLCGVMARGLSIDRDDRFPDMAALADALDACVAPTAASTENVQPVPAVRRSRRGLMIAIAGGAAIAGVTTVLVVSRMLSREDSVTASSNNVTLADTTADAAQLVATPDAPTQIATTTDAAELPRPGVLPGPGSARQLKPVPIAPSGPPTAIPTDVQSQIDLGLAAARRAILKRDGMTCLAAVNALPTNVPPMVAYNIDLHRGQCEMLRGDCEKGIKRVDTAMEGMGSPPNGEAIALANCPVTGPYEVRFKRLVAQAHTAKTPALCRTYVQPAKTLAGEATAANEKVTIGGVLRQLGRCIGDGGDCAEAEALWKLGYDLDQIAYKWDVAKCAMPAAATPPANPMVAVQTLTETLNRTQQAITRRDTRACRDLLATPPSDIPQGMQMSFDLLAGFCRMMLGDCKAGSALVAKAYGGNAGADTIESNANIYCPIAGTLEQRLTRMRAQLGAFADTRGGNGHVEWCSYMIGAAKTAAREAQTADHQKRAAKVLQHIATCISNAGRCAEANELWSLSVATDANANPTPKLSAKCP